MSFINITALNEGQLVQVHVARNRSATILYVMTREQEFSDGLELGPRLLTEDQYQKFPFGKEIPHPELTLYGRDAEITAPHIMVK